MRRSRRNGQLRRVSSRSLGSQAAMRTSSVSWPARAMTRPKGSARNEPPQNSRPPPDGPFVADPVDGRDVDAVGDRVRPLDRLPGARLGLAELGLLGGVPADRRGIEEDLGPSEGRQPGGLGIPLVPADERADPGVRGLERLEPEVAGREVVLLVIERVVGDVHLAIAARGACRRRRGRPPCCGRHRLRGARRPSRPRPCSSRARAGPVPRWSGRGSARRGRTVRRPRPGRSTACGTARAGRRPARRAAAAERSIAQARRRLSSGSVEHRIWIRPTVNGRDGRLMATRSPKRDCDGSLYGAGLRSYPNHRHRDQNVRTASGTVGEGSQPRRIEARMIAARRVCRPKTGTPRC